MIQNYNSRPEMFPSSDSELIRFLDDDSTLVSRQNIANMLQVALKQSVRLDKFTQACDKLLTYNLYQQTELCLTAFHQNLTDLHHKNLLFYYPARAGVDEDIVDKQLIQGVHSASLLIYDTIKRYRPDIAEDIFPPETTCFRDIVILINQLSNQKLRQYLDRNVADSPYLYLQPIRANNIYKFSINNFVEKLSE